MHKLNQKGFSAIEAALAIIFVAIIGATGYYVYHANKSTTDTLSAAAKDSSGSVKFASKKPAGKTAAADLYAGWKTYTLKFEKLTFKYPTSWTLQDDSGSAGLSPNTDSVSFTASDGFNASIDDGWDGGGDPLNLDAADPVAVKFLGGPAYMVFSHRRMAALNGENPNYVSGATLMLKPSTQYGQGSTAGYFPQDKYAHGDPGVNSGGSTMLIGGSYPSPKDFATVSQAMSDPEFNNLKLLIQSMHY